MRTFGLNSDKSFLFSSNRDVEFEKKELENKQNEINNEIDTVEENRQKCSTELRTIELEYQNQRRSLHVNELYDFFY